MAGGLFFTESLGFYEHSDAELVCCDGLTIPVHGVIIQQHSAPLNKAITARKTEFYAGPHKPGEVVKIAVQGDGQTINRVVSFIYTANYSDDDSTLSFAVTTPPSESLLIDLNDDLPITKVEDGSIESLQFWFQSLEISPKNFKAPIFSKAWANAKVFRVASEWGVERLVVESSNRFTHFIQGSSSQDGFKEFVSAVYSSFPDNELCDYIAEECTNNVDFVVEQLGHILKDNGLLSYKILQKVVNRTDTSPREALHLLSPAQRRVVSLRRRVVELEAAQAKAVQMNNTTRRQLLLEASQSNGHTHPMPEVPSSKEIEELRTQLAQKSEDVEHMVDMLTKGDVDLAKLRKRVKDTSDKYDDLKVTNARLKKDIRDSNAGNMKLSKDIKGLKEEDKKKESRIKKADSLLKEKDSRIEELQAEIHKLRDHNRKSTAISATINSNPSTSRPVTHDKRGDQYPTSTASSNLIDISPAASLDRQSITTPLIPLASVNSVSIPNAPTQTSAGPETFVDRLRRQRQGAAGLAVAASNSAPNQAVMAPAVNGVRPSAPQAQSSSMQMAPRPAAVPAAPDNHTIATYHSTVAQKDHEIARLRRDLKFSRQQLSDSRNGPASTIPTRGGPIRQFGGDGRLEAILKALKEASLEHRACGECMFNFNSQFRGITEDRNIPHLILKCTKCEAETARWNV